ncbi:MULTISPECIES: BT_3928 family protein [unclassified Mucilaginibacter]|uniref:BT_3928 family protein n=1 Tax=unclassified Mucilaginibacter TaxID=2617802 RepID=UPI002AC8EA91|nr:MULTISPECIES: BT_3928 family protein [unclassified Mucilaginibacter]MEB0278752.1 DoxX family protein [Mucilaginibacter sp. 10B2]MEB0301714.1 DoxX family protein [Mucilaginibacter sp. 5C4]WPX23296.1 DoxX family protein [Mucilaginibacter sp. 5C4]
MKNKLIWFCRIAVGLLFIFSGLIKANDPLGFSYKLEEYFEVFHTTWLNGFALSLSILLCALEMILGFALLVGARAIQVIWGLLLLIIFFAFLTFYSAYFKVVQTCGCFGDAIPLTPWQSFTKDLILLLLVLVLFVNRKTVKSLTNAKTSDKLLIGATIVSIGFGLYTYNFLPVMDFLPYKVGANILQEMKTPPGGAADEFEVTYVLKNKNTQDTKTMSDKEYLKSGIWKDTTWAVQGRPESKLIKKGFEPKIRDLNIQDAQANNYNQELLSSPFYSLWIVAYNLDDTNPEAVNRINALAANLTQNYNTRTILLTSNAPENAQKFAKDHKLVSELFYADGVPLKSMVRANPGIILIKNGTVINKWHFHNMPKYEDIVKKYLSK